jgi:hypothetical protein
MPILDPTTPCEVIPLINRGEVFDTYLLVYSRLTVGEWNISNIEAYADATHLKLLADDIVPADFGPAGEARFYDALNADCDKRRTIARLIKQRKAQLVQAWPHSPSFSP